MAYRGMTLAAAEMWLTKLKAAPHDFARSIFALTRMISFDRSTFAARLHRVDFFSCFPPVLGMIYTTFSIT
jgi:hypothetical protein